jgi:hypothetical protein
LLISVLYISFDRARRFANNKAHYILRICSISVNIPASDCAATLAMIHFWKPAELDRIRRAKYVLALDQLAS